MNIFTNLQNVIEREIVMGFFSKKVVQVENSIESKLIEMGYDIAQFSHDTLEAGELSIDNEVAGMIKTSYGDFIDKNNFFNSIMLSDYRNGRREIDFSKTGINERDIKNIVDFLYQYLGSDNVHRNEFNSNDLKKIRENFENFGELPFRYWVANDFSINFYIVITNEFMMLNIIKK